MENFYWCGYHGLPYRSYLIAKSYSLVDAVGIAYGLSLAICKRPAENSCEDVSELNVAVNGEDSRFDKGKIQISRSFVVKTDYAKASDW